MAAAHWQAGHWGGPHSPNSRDAIAASTKPVELKGLMNKLDRRLPIPQPLERPPTQ